MAYIEITPAMISAAADAVRSNDEGGELEELMAHVLRAAFNAGEIRSDPEPPSVVAVTLYDHHKDTETIRLALNAPAYDLGPKGAVIRKIEVTA